MLSRRCVDAAPPAAGTYPVWVRRRPELEGLSLRFDGAAWDFAALPAGVRREDVQWDPTPAQAGCPP